MEDRVNSNVAREVELVGEITDLFENFERPDETMVEFLCFSTGDDVASAEPDFVARFERRCLLSRPVVEAFHPVCGGSEFLTKDLVGKGKFVSEVGGRDVDVLVVCWAKGDVKVGMVTFVGEEGSHVDCGVVRVVVGVLSQWKQVLPVVLLVVDVDAKELFESLVEAPSRTVRLRVVGGRHVEFCTSEIGESPPE